MYPYRYGYPNTSYQQPYNYQQMSTMPQNQNSYAQAPAESPIQDIRFVNRAQAEAYIVYPNSKVMLIDNESGMAYIKTADAMGQCRTDYYRFQPVNADGSPIKPQEPSPQINLDEYIKKEDLEKLGFVTIAQYNELAQRLEQIQRQITGGRQNVATNKQP